MLKLLIHLALDALIVVLLLWMVFFDGEKHNPITRYLIPKLQDPFVWLGLNSNWTMFAPDPPARTIWPTARLTMQNQDVVHWEPVEFEGMTAWDKFRLKKYHKFFHEVARSGAAYQTKRDFVEHLLKRRLHPERCVTVEIFMVVRPTPPFHGPRVQGPTVKKLVYTFHPTEGAS